MGSTSDPDFVWALGTHRYLIQTDYGVSGPSDLGYRGYYIRKD